MMHRKKLALIDPVVSEEKMFETVDKTGASVYYKLTYEASAQVR